MKFKSNNQEDIEQLQEIHQAERLDNIARNKKLQQETNKRRK